MFSLEIVKRHPVISGVAFLGGAILLYLLVKGHSASATSNDSSTSDAQLQAVQSAEAITNAQYGSQVQIAQIQGQVAAGQTAAQLEAVKAETQSAEAIVTTQTLGAVQQTQIQADATTEQAQINATAQTDIAHDYFNTQLETAQAAITAQSAADQHRFDLAQGVITQAGKDKSRSSTGWTQIISALEGRGPEAIAANQPSQVASSNAVGSILSSVTKGIFSLF